MTLFQETVQAAGAVTALVANRVDLGDITLPAGDWVITRVWGHTMHAGTITASMSLHGYIQLESEDCLIAPFEFPVEPVTAPLGTGEMSGAITPPRKYIVGCPVKGGTTIHVYHVADGTITTVLSETIVTIEFAKSSPFGGGQLHMKCGEPAVAQSVSDGGTASLTDIKIKASKLHAAVVYQGATVAVASTGFQLMWEIKSDDFAEVGPHRFAPTSMRAGGVATNSSGQTNQTFLLELDATFRASGSEQTISCGTIAYDACSTAPLCNWCLIYSR